MVFRDAGSPGWRWNPELHFVYRLICIGALELKQIVMCRLITLSGYVFLAGVMKYFIEKMTAALTSTKYSV